MPETPDAACIDRLCQHVHALRTGDHAGFVRFCQATGSVVTVDTQHGQTPLHVRRSDGLTVGIACGMGVSDVIPQVVLALLGPWGFSLGWVATATKRLQQEATAQWRQVRAQKRKENDAAPLA